MSTTSAASGNGDDSDLVILRTATSLETLSVDMYEKALGLGGVEARHVTVFDTVLQNTDPLIWAPNPFQKTADAAPKEAEVPAA